MSNGFSDGSEYDDDDIDIDIESNYESENDGLNGVGTDKLGDNVDEKVYPVHSLTKKATSSYGKRIEIVNFSVENVLRQDEQVRKAGMQYNLCYRSGKADNKIVKTVLQAHGFREVNETNNDFNIYWSGGHVRPHVLRAFHEFQKVNHFPRSFELTRKDRLFKNVQRMQTLRGLKHFDFIPPSFVIPGEYTELCQYFARDKGPLIVKPVALSRGRGIFLCPNPSQIPLDESLIVCRYINNPYLIDGLKFDLRVYVLVTSFEPLIVYLYEEGLARFATERYQNTVRHLRTQCMHLTNYSVNKKNDNFVHNEDADVEDFGSKWSLGALLRYLKSQQVDTTSLMMKIEDIIIKSLISVEPYVSSACRMFQPHRGNCFELYGYDIIIDENLKPWLLEVNLSPSLACESPLDFKIKSHLITDLLSLTGVTCQNPSAAANQNRGPPPWVTRPFSNYFRSFSRLRTPSSGPSPSATAPTANSSSVNSRAGSAKSSKSVRTNQNNSNATSKPIRRPTAGLRHIRSSTSATNYTQTVNSDARRSNITKQQAATATASSSSSTRSNDEVSRIVRRFKEEQSRRGGWVCIFPTEQSLDTYGHFMGASAMPSSTFENSGSSSMNGISSIYGGLGHSTSSFYIGGSINRAIHTRLFPNKHGLPPTSNDTTNESSVTSTTVLSGGARGAQSGGNIVNCRKRQYSQRNYSATQQRLSLYERKLGQCASSQSSPSPNHHDHQHHHHHRRHDQASSTGTLDMCNENNRRNTTINNGNDNKISQSKKHDVVRARSKSSQPRPRSPCTSISSSSCKSLASSSSSSSSSSSIAASSSSSLSSVSNNNNTHQHQQEEREIERLVENGAELSVTEARVSFGQYLSRVRTRLIIESKSSSPPASAADIELGHEQVDLVLRFLKRAWNVGAADWHTTVPNKAPGNLQARQATLAASLHHFILHYRRKSPATTAADGDDQTSPRFLRLVAKATEPQLERLLSNYTRKHKTASIFLNIDTTNNKTTTSRGKVIVSSNGDSGMHRSASLSSLTSGSGQRDCHQPRKPTEHTKSRLTRPLTGATRLGRPPQSSTNSRRATPHEMITSNTAGSNFNSVESNSISRALDRLAQEHRAKRLMSSSLTNLFNNNQSQHQQQAFSTPTTNHNSQYSTTNKNSIIQTNSANNNSNNGQATKPTNSTNHKPPISQSNRVPFVIKRF